MSYPQLENLIETTGEALATTLETRDLLKALEALTIELQAGKAFRREMENLLRVAQVPEIEIQEGLQGIADFLKPHTLKLKLKRELGEENPFTMYRLDFGNTAFEGWAPLGLLVHVTPANAWTVGFLSVVEGLLAGNVNFLKLSSSDSDFAIHMLEKLKTLEPSGHLAKRILYARIPSSDREAMKSLLSQADGVAAWGGEEAIKSLKEMTPEGARFIDWGPKISFAYFTKEAVTEESLFALAKEVCEGDQQACSAPQCVYLEGADELALKAFAKRLALQMEKASKMYPARKPDVSEASEITVVTRMQELKRALDQGDVIKGEGYRLLIDTKSSLRPSPLYRTLWVKGLERRHLVPTLRPLRRYLQTVGIAAAPVDAIEISRLAYAAGALRVTPMGEMMASYEGEPHDGVYALARYARRVSLRGDHRFKTLGRLEELKPQEARGPELKIMNKEDFQAMVVPMEYAALTFRSGGSSGDPKFSRFTYSDYHAQMRLAGFGLVAAGLDPKSDRCMNLFFGGGLYGGFVSFFSVLESIGAIQFPMAALPDHKSVGEAIITHQANTLLGMPSYLVQLFAANDELFKKHRVVKKVFYGGEHFQEAQKNFLKQTYGVELIHSAAYGSVDAGPLGYQCTHMSGSEHHLHTDAHIFEVVAMDKDEPAPMGRLLVTTKLREGQHIERYDLGDLVRVLPGPCGCGRVGLKVELLGRHGDVVRVGAAFFNYARIARVLAEETGYSGELQMKILPPSSAMDKEQMVFVIDKSSTLTDQQIESVLLKHEPDFFEAVKQDRVLSWSVERVNSHEMERVAGSGKLKHIVDRRHS